MKDDYKDDVDYISKNPNFFMNIPYRLEIEGKPELRNLPYNILFTSILKGKKTTQIHTALYIPDFSTLEESDKYLKMNYYNELNRFYRVEITYNKEKNSWEGWRYKGEEQIGGAVGPDWKNFFAHLTLLGVHQVYKNKVD